MSLLDRVEACYNKQVTDKIVIALAKASVRSAIEAADSLEADSLSVPLRRRKGGLFNPVWRMSSRRLLETVIEDLQLNQTSWAVAESASVAASQEARPGGYGCPDTFGWSDQPRLVLKPARAVPLLFGLSQPVEIPVYSGQEELQKAA